MSITSSSLPGLAFLLLATACQEGPTFGERPDDAPEVRPDAPTLDPEAIVDEITQVSPARIDVLWIIDDSGSMAQEQRWLAGAFPRFMDLVVDAHADTHIGVITTDTNAPDAGKLRQAAAYTYITTATPNPIATFGQMVQVGTGGSGFETGRRAAWTALSEPRLTGANHGFYREDATLHLIFVSDEEDNSGPTPSTDTFLDFLAELKPDPDLTVQAHAIVLLDDDSGQCSGQVGTGYLTLADATAGNTFSLCDDDWDPILETLGLTASGLTREAFLTQRPDPATLRVEVVEPGGFVWDGVFEPSAKSTAPVDDPCDAARCTAYTYDSQRNAIRLIDRVPPEGSVIRMTYVPEGDT